MDEIGERFGGAGLSNRSLAASLSSGVSIRKLCCADWCART
jgi:hypothetical protein